MGHNRKPFVVDQVIGPGAEAGICQVAMHAQIGGKEEKGEESPRGVQLRKKKEGKDKHQKFFEAEKCFHVGTLCITYKKAVDKWRDSVDNLR